MRYLIGSSIKFSLNNLSLYPVTNTSKYIKLKLSNFQCWIDTDTKLNRLNWMGIPFLPYPIPTNISILKPVRSLEWYIFGDQRNNCLYVLFLPPIKSHS